MLYVSHFFALPTPSSYVRQVTLAVRPPYRRKYPADLIIVTNGFSFNGVTAPSETPSFYEHFSKSTSFGHAMIGNVPSGGA